MADKPSLQNIGYYSWGSLGSGDPNDPEALATLRAIQQYDPSAAYVPTQDGSGTVTGYTLSYDATKLPGFGGQGHLANVNNGVNTTRGDFQTGGNYILGSHFGGHLKDPSLIQNDPIYGQYTPTSNIVQDNNSLMDILGPLAVAGFAFGAPFLASAMSNGALGAGAAAAGTAGINPDTLATAGMTSGNSGFSSALGDVGGGAAAGTAGINPDTLATAGMTSGNSGYSGWTQAAAPVLEQSTPARVMDVLRNGGVPGLSNIGQSARELLTSAAGNLARLGQAGLLGGTGAPVVGGGGSSLLGGGGGTMDALSLLKGFYGDPLSKALLAAELQKRRGLFYE